MVAGRPLTNLLGDIRACTLCADLPLGPKPIVQGSGCARILIAGQAPGRITHHKGIAFDDPSGNRLREWMGISRETFYDPEKIAIAPMGFCFPGTGKGGDLPPRPECAPQWRARLLEQWPDIKLTLIIGKYALDWHFNEGKKMGVTDHVKTWESHLPARLPLPHPSPRNNRWLRNNPWFEAQTIPALQKRISGLLT